MPTDNLAARVLILANSDDPGSRIARHYAALGFVSLPNTVPTDEWALAREAALLLDGVGRPGRATEVWRAIFASEDLPRDLRPGCLRRG